MEQILGGIQVIGAGDCDAVRSQLRLGPADVGGVGALDSIWFAGLEGARCLRTSQRPNRFVLATLDSTSAWRASSFPLARIDPGVVADGPSDRSL